MKVSAEKIDLMRKLYDSGITIPQIADHTGVSYSTAYCYTKAYKNGFKSLYDFHQYLAQRNGYSSRAEYKTELERRNTDTAFADFLNERLKLLKKTGRWLARIAGISLKAISSYRTGKSIPRKDIHKRIFKALDVEYSSIDELAANLSASIGEA